MSDGVHFLVLEFVPGETLAERIKRGPIPVDEALPLFKQIAEGLEAAHEKGVIHRDLKPANAKVTPEGKVKVLDFGLAKAMAGEAPDQGLSESPTITRGATEAGILLGTAPYMSPEQARGKAVDKRTDLWAFGCCLYEALTGKAAFLGETVSDTIAAVLKQEPDWQSLPASTPVPIRTLLRRCLQKDSSRRLHDIADARIEIEETLNEPFETSQTVAAADAKIGRRVIPIIIATALSASIVTAVSFWIFTPPTAPAQERVTRSVITLPPDDELAISAQNTLAISPNGQYMTYEEESGQLYLRALNELQSKPVEGAEASRARMPFFSPDSQWLGFWADGNLMKVSTIGGVATAIAAVGSDLRGASWGSDGRILFTLGPGSGISQISDDCDEPKVLTTPDRERGEKTHRFPQLLPGGKAVLFTLGTVDITSYDDASIAVLLLDTGDYHVVIEGGTDARYSETGHLIYARDGTLLASPFDLAELQVKGSPIPVVQGVNMSAHHGYADFSISSDGSLLYALVNHGYRNID